ncbi:S8 family serine peptidase [Microbacterium sp. SLBN-146]|uniref:S8 family serine peptidase n=1 Tax=Microbacterium sp. SLBN-146 TaxID=2768457 RepID=UPI0011548142|nr:S8 family serine peptidase [Microbacterium sp. SLBN-146]TQJ31843.1 hypothetical protein FBY39_2328 [Microbacterium sp. SLBN-146]
MARSDGRLPGTGFDDDDPVEVLGSAWTMGQLRSPGGAWLIKPVRPPEYDVLPWPDGEWVMAVVDTGVCDDYPPLAGRIVEQVDLTGEGVRDEDGHGTAVTAIMLAYNSPRTKIVSVKALDRDGASSVGRLAVGMRKAAALLRGRGTIINLSAGRRTPACAGTCPLCTTAKQLEADGFRLLAAAGNTPGVTYCPAKSTAFAITSTEQDAAPGTIQVELPPWEPLDPEGI